MTRLLSAAASVHIGNRRGNNEDNLYFNGVYLTEQTRETPADFEAAYDGARARWFAVCDGMGGEDRGELASLLAVQTLHAHAEALKKAADSGIGVAMTSAKTAEASLEAYIGEANAKICAAQRSGAGGRVGTTLALLGIKKDTAHICNIGDSRVYLFRQGALDQLSEDHTSVARSVKSGLLTPEQARTHPRRNSLSQYLGIDPSEMIIQPYHAKIKMRDRDIFLLCSDGLTDTVDESDIARVLLEAQNPAEAARTLTARALAGSGKDNITVIVLAYRRQLLPLFQPR